MAHKRLKGCRKNRLSIVRKNCKTKDKKGKEGDEAEGGGLRKKETHFEKKTARPAKKGGKQMNAKEAKAQGLLEKMHRNLYGSGERILLVGEGNFSFAHALCRNLDSGAGVYATCLDTEAQLSKKYADVANYRKLIEATDGTVLTGVDASRLHKVKEFKGAFRKIVFNFPHLGSGEKDMDKNIAQHRQLLAAFFISAEKCLDPGHDSFIHVALKIGEPYKSWKVVQTARAAVPELDLHTVVPFVESAWEGYSHRRTKGFDDSFSKSASEELSKGAKVYVFRKNKRMEEDDS